MATNLQLPNLIPPAQVGLGNLYNQMVPPQQPEQVMGLNRQGLSDMFLAMANNSGVDPRTGLVNWGIGAGASAYSKRVSEDEAKQAAYELELAKDKQALIQELKKKYTPESIQDFVSQGMSDYSLLKELPKDFATRKQTGVFEDGKFIAGEGDTYNVSYDQYGNVTAAVQAEPDKATTKEFYNPSNRQTELWRVDPTTGRKLALLGITGEKSPLGQASQAKAGSVEIYNAERGVTEIWTTNPYTGSKVEYLGDKAPSATQLKAAGSKASDSDIAKLDENIGLVDKLLNHKGRYKIAGVVDQYAGQRTESGEPTITGALLAAGTESTDALSILSQIESQNFLSAIQAMKGMGALSNAEGQKVQSAMADLKTARGDEEAFDRALQRLRDSLVTLKKVATQESGMNRPTIRRYVRGQGYVTVNQ